MMTTPAIRTHVRDEYVIRLRCVCVLTFFAEGHAAAWDADGEGRGGGEGMALLCSGDCQNDRHLGQDEWTRTVPQEILDTIPTSEVNRQKYAHTCA